MPTPESHPRRFGQRAAGAIACFLPLTACGMVVLDPAGDVARQQSQIVMISTGLMLLIILPVLALIGIFAWRYRAANREAKYEPDWDHSAGLELIIWSAPLAIVIALGALTWISTHLLDPYRPIGRIDRGKPVPAGAVPLEIQVVAMDWKWLFFYPEQRIATVNALALPIDRQVRFRITATSVMNSFYIPALAGQIYAMPGMETKLHAVLNKPGRYKGFSANYSGAGFSGMRFPVEGMDSAKFDAWAANIRAKGGTLDVANYLRLERPSENVPPQGFGRIAPGLFDRIVNMCVRPGTTCMSDTMKMDMRHGERPGVNDVAPAGQRKPEGALQKDPDEKGAAPHSSAPVGDKPGKAAPNADANRNMTMIDRRVPAAIKARRVPAALQGRRGPAASEPTNV